MAQTSRKKTQGRSALVAKYFTGRPGEVLWLDDIAKATGVPAATAQQAIWYLMNREKNPLPLKLVQHGQAWVYTPGAEPAVDSEPSTPTEKRMFEELTVTDKGTVIAQGTDGRLYTVKLLEI